MQYKNYLPYATSMESPPPGLTTVFNFSLKEEKKRPKEEEKNRNPNTSEHFGTKKWYLQRQYSTCNLFGLKRD